jgi:hypothetical protein
LIDAPIEVILSPKFQKLNETKDLIIKKLHELLTKSWQDTEEEVEEDLEKHNEKVERSFTEQKERVVKALRLMKKDMLTTFNDIINDAQTKYAELKTKYDTGLENLKKSINIKLKWIKLKFLYLQRDIYLIFDALNTKVVEKIVKFVDCVVKRIDEKFPEIGNAIDRGKKVIKEKLTGIVDRILNPFKEIDEGLRDVVDNILKTIVDLINGFNDIEFSWPKIPSIFGTSTGGENNTAKFSVPPIAEVPQAARGGIVTRDMLINAGEGGKKEGIIPLENPNSMKMIANAITKAMSSSNGQSNPTFVFEIGTLIGDDRSLTELERRMRNVRYQESNRTGGVSYV